MNPKPQTITEYINETPKDVQSKLREMHSLLHKVAPEAEEGLKWGVPALSSDRILFTFAGFKNHISFYPTPAAIKEFEKELSDYETSSSTIQFPLDKPLPTVLIQKIAAYRLKEVKENDAKWM